MAMSACSVVLDTLDIRFEIDPDLRLWYPELVIGLVP